MTKHSPKFPAFRVYERTSKNGTRYFLERFGALKLIGFVDDKAESDNPCWQFYVQEPDPSRNADRPTAETNGTRDWQAPIKTNGAKPAPFDNDFTEAFGA